MILIKLAKNKNKTIKEACGKYYARPVVTETIGIDELAEHMSSHNTPFSKGAIKGADAAALAALAAEFAAFVTEYTACAASVARFAALTAFATASSAGRDAALQPIPLF